MKKLRVSLYSLEEKNIADFNNAAQHLQNDIEVKILANEEEVISGVSSKDFDLLLLDSSLETLVKNRIFKMVEMMYSESAYTELNFEYGSFITLKLNQFIQKWKDANTDEKYNFVDSPLS